MRLPPAKYQKAFKTIRGNPCSKSRDDSNVTDIERLIIDEFTGRFKIVSESKLIIPCGIFEQCFTEKMKVNLPWYDGIPHPSYKNWGASGQGASGQASMLLS